MVITKKQLKQTTLLALLFAFFFTMLMPVGLAAEDNASSFPEAMLDFVNSGVIDVIKNNLTSNNGQNPLYTYIMNTDPNSPTIVSAFANLTKGVCGFIVIIIAVAKYFQQLEKGLDPLEEVYKMLSELCIVGIVIANCDIILNYTVTLGEWFISIAANIDELSKEPTKITLEIILGEEYDGNLLQWIHCVFILFIPWVMTVLLQIVAQFTAFSLLIELGIRKAFAPVAICDIYSEGLRSPGVRYLKRFLATFIKIAICLLVCYLGRTLMGAAGHDNIANADGLLAPLQYIFRIIAINFTVIGVMNKTGEFANDIVGV